MRPKSPFSMLYATSQHKKTFWTYKKAQKASEITEDELKNLLEKIQKMTDSYIANIDKLAEEKGGAV